MTSIRPLVSFLLVLTACGGGSASASTGATTPTASAGEPGQVRIEAGDKISGTGTLDRSAVLDALTAHLDAARTCYRHELERDAYLHGRVIVEFTVGETGGVTEVMARADGIGDPAVASCASGVVSGLTLPAPTGGEVRFRYPFVFDP